MDGDFSPLLDLQILAEKFNAQLIVDEAHSTGVFGKNGSGLVCQLGLSSKIPIRIHTFGKAIGTHGACVTGPKIIKDYLINFSRAFIYTTAMPFHNLVSIKLAFEELAQNPALQSKLIENIAFFKSQIDSKIQTIQSKSAIQVLIYTGNEKVSEMAQYIQNHGFMIKPIRSPTVSKGSERLRVCIHSYNNKVEIAALCTLLQNTKT